MITIYLAAFAVSVVGLIALFSLKYVEVRTGVVALPRVRQALDTRALAVRRVGMRVIRTIEHLPSILGAFGYLTLHLFAVLVAHAARAAEKRAHSVADFVSHKRGFKRRQTQSEFLKEVTEYKEALVVPQEVLKQEV